MRSGAANNVNRASRSGRARIVIVGGGFAGAFCAKALSKRLKGEAEIASKVIPDPLDKSVAHLVAKAVAAAARRTGAAQSGARGSEQGA